MARMETEFVHSMYHGAPWGADPDLVEVLEPEEADGIVEEDVVLLLLAQERRRLDTVHRLADGVHPDHLVRSEQDPLPEARIHQPLQVAMELRARARPVDHGDVDVDLRVGIEKR